MTSLIVIPTHRTGVAMLENLLKSLKGFEEYPILIVICDYKKHDERVFQSIKDRFLDLPLSWEQIKTNAFELGGLYTAYEKTDYDELLLLSHSCEIVNLDILDLVFKEHRNKSIAFALETGNWNSIQGENLDLTLKYLDGKTNAKLIGLGEVQFWQGHIGKYRRAILDKMNLLEFLPTNMIEAISKSELLFTSTYQSLDPETIVLFPTWKDGEVFENKFGRTRLKIANEFLIKWKTHWTTDMVFDEVRDKQFPQRIKKLLAARFPGFYSTLRQIRRSVAKQKVDSNF